MSLRRIAATLTALAMLPAALISFDAAAAASCEDYKIIGARGTDGEVLGADAGEAAPMGTLVFQTSTRLRDILGENGKTARLVGVDYPASGMPSLTDPGGYPLSVMAGITATVREIQNLCVGSKAILVGYSQGADATSRAVYEGLVPSERQKIAGVLSFGDPGFAGRDQQAGFGNYDPTRSGMLGPRSPIWSDKLTTPVVSVCHQWDVFCR